MKGPYLCSTFLLCGFVAMFSFTSPVYGQNQNPGWQQAEIPPVVAGKPGSDVTLVYRTILRAIRFNAGPNGSSTAGSLSIAADTAVIKNLPPAPQEGVVIDNTRQVRIAVRDSKGGLVGMTRVMERRNDSQPTIAQLTPDQFAEPLPLAPGGYVVEYVVLGQPLAKLPFTVSAVMIDGTEEIVADGVWTEWGYLDVESPDKPVNLGVWLAAVSNQAETVRLEVSKGGQIVADGAVYPSVRTLQPELITLQHVTSSTGKRGSVLGTDLAEWDGEYTFQLSRKQGEGGFESERAFKLSVATGTPAGLDLARETGGSVNAATGEYWMRARK